MLKKKSPYDFMKILYDYNETFTAMFENVVGRKYRNFLKGHTFLPTAEYNKQVKIQ